MTETTAEKATDMHRKDKSPKESFHFFMAAKIGKIILLIKLWKKMEEFGRMWKNISNFATLNVYD